MAKSGQHVKYHYVEAIVPDGEISISEASRIVYSKPPVFLQASSSTVVPERRFFEDKMPKGKLRTLMIPVNTVLLFGLSFNLYFNVNAKGNQVVRQESHNINALNIYERMSKIEAENQQDEAEISILKTKSDEDKKYMALLTIKVDEGLHSLSKLEAENTILKIKVNEDRHSIEELTGRVAMLKGATSTNSSETGHKDKVLGRQKRPYRLVPKKIISHKNKDTFEEKGKNALAQFFGPPTNCSEIGMLGYTLNGYYLVKSTDPINKNKIKIVYCAFRQAQGASAMITNQVLQTPIGNVEVKTRSVYFHVRMTENFESGWNKFKSRDINVGGAMSERKFTAPVSGTYHFHFYGIVHNPGSNFKIAIGHRDHAWQYTEIKCQNCTTQFISMASTFHLDANVDIVLYKPQGTSGILAGGGFYDSYSYFTGWIVEEDLNLA